MKIQAGWTDRKKGWTLRYNQLIDNINEYTNPDKIKPKLTPEELDWYNKSLEALKQENDEIAKECKKNGVPEWRTRYGKVEVEDNL